MSPPPSARTYPSDAASKLLQRPSGDSIHDCDSAIVNSGARIRLTPPASANEDSPQRRLWQARWIARSEEEQPVSTARLGPVQSKK